jgi:hypothetical protein
MPSLKWKYHYNAFRAVDMEDKIAVKSGNSIKE